MTSDKILHYSQLQYDNEFFLPYLKNLKENAKSTIYQNFDYLNNQNVIQLAEDKESDSSIFKRKYKIYDYVPFEEHDN